MSYDYKTQRKELFDDEGQRLFLAVRDQVKYMLDTSGAITMGCAMQLPKGIGAADSWSLMACVDRMVELKEIREIPQERCAGQNRVFVYASYEGH